MVSILYKKFWIYIIWISGIISISLMAFNTSDSIEFWIGVTLYLIILCQVLNPKYHWQRNVRSGHCKDCLKCRHKTYCSKSEIFDEKHEKVNKMIKEFLGW